MGPVRHPWSEQQWMNSYVKYLEKAVDNPMPMKDYKEQVWREGKGWNDL